MNPVFDLLSYFLSILPIFEIVLDEAEGYHEELEKYDVHSKAYYKLAFHLDLFKLYCEELLKLHGMVEKLERLKKSGIVTQTVTHYKVCDKKMSKKRMRETGQVIASLNTLDPENIEKEIQNIDHCLDTMEIIKQLSLLPNKIEKDLQKLKRKGDLL